MANEAREHQAFDVNKAIAATAYLVENTGASMYSVMKMMYLADKTHLGKYGRFISGDSYCAMKKGPVPSSTYNMIKFVRGEETHLAGMEIAREYLGYADNHAIRILKTPDYDELSDSDIECLDEVVRVYKSMGWWAVKNLSHDPAWEKTWGSISLRRSKPMSMEVIASDLDCAEELQEHLQDDAPGHGK